MRSSIEKVSVYEKKTNVKNDQTKENLVEYARENEH